MTKKAQILAVYLFHLILISISFFLLHERADAFLVTVCVLYGVYLIFYIVANCKSYIPWILLLHHFIGSVVQIILNYFEIIPPDGGFLSGIGQAVYAFFFVPGYFAILLLTHLGLLAIYKIRTSNTTPKSKEKASSDSLD